MLDSVAHVILIALLLGLCAVESRTVRPMSASDVTKINPTSDEPTVTAPQGQSVDADSDLSNLVTGLSVVDDTEKSKGDSDSEFGREVSDVIVSPLNIVSDLDSKMSLSNQKNDSLQSTDDSGDSNHSRSDSSSQTEAISKFRVALNTLQREMTSADMLLHDPDAVLDEFSNSLEDLRKSRARVQDLETTCGNEASVRSEADGACLDSHVLESKVTRRLGAMRRTQTTEELSMRQQMTHVKLENIKTPKFTGQVTEYMRFKSQFQDLIRNSCPSNIALMKLRDEALTRGSPEYLLVSGTRSIEEAFKELDGAFMDSEIIQSALIAQIRDLKPAQNYYDSQMLRLIVSTVISVMKDLDVLGCTNVLDMSVFSSLMIKIPARLRDEIDRAIVLAGAQKPLSAIEKIECFVSETKFRCRLIDTHTHRTKAYSPSSVAPFKKTKPQPPGLWTRNGPSETLAQGQEPQQRTCLFHPEAKRHWTNFCVKLQSLSAREIRETLERNRYCLSCIKPLGPSHHCNIVCPEFQCPTPTSHSKLVHTACVLVGSAMGPELDTESGAVPQHEGLDDDGDKIDEDVSDTESLDSNTFNLGTVKIESEVQPECIISDSGISTADYVGHSTLRPSHVAHVRAKNGEMLPVNILYDGGSDLSEVMSSVVHQTDSKSVGVIPNFRVNVAASTVPTNIGKCELHNLPLLDSQGRTVAVVNVVAVPWIGKLRDVDTKSAMSEVRKHGGSIDGIIPPTSGPIHVLLGSNCPQLFPSRVFSLQSLEIGLTKFGPILYGSHPSFARGVVRDEIIHTKLFTSLQPDLPDSLLSFACSGFIPATLGQTEGDIFDQFTSLDVDATPCAKCGHSPVSPDKEGERRLLIYNDCIRFSPEEKKVFTTFPWKADLSTIPDNKASALQRLKRLTTAAAKDPDLTTAYVAEMDRMIQAGILVEVTEVENDAWKSRGGSVWYVGHFPVKNPSSESTPVRPVFDPSISFKGITLSKLWEQPPNLIPQIVDMYVRFRDKPIAVCLDFKKAYWTLWLGEVESHMHRIVYNRLDPTAPVKTYRITRNSWGMVPAGALCSLAMITVAEHFKDQFPQVNEFVRTQLYVDDGATSCETVEEALQLAKDTDWVMSRGGFELKHFIIGGRQVSSSGVALPETVPDVVRLGRAQERILGAIWEPTRDVLSFVCRINFSKKRNGAFTDRDITPDDFDDRFPERLTLRMYLSVISTLFDPLGLASPVTITLKHEFGRLLGLGLSWDDEIPRGSLEGPSFERCRELIRSLLDVTKLSFPRCMRPLDVVVVGNPILVGFCDASELAFAGCVFYCYSLSDGSVRSTLNMSKATPLPKRSPLLTIPRAELEACRILAELVSRVQRGSTLIFDRVILLSDSTICLGQILASPYRLKQWPATRVQMILDRTEKSSWYHIRSENNVADIATRGARAEFLGSESVWQIGASFMRLPIQSWPIVPAVDCPLKLGLGQKTDEQLEVRVRDPRMLLSGEPNIHAQVTMPPDSIHPLPEDFQLTSQAMVELVDFLSTLNFTQAQPGSSWTRLRRIIARTAAFVLNVPVLFLHRQESKKRRTIDGFSEMTRKDQRDWIERNDQFSPHPSLMFIAEVVICRQVQDMWTPKDIQDMSKLNPHQDACGLWRALGRVHTIENAPILLPGDHPLSLVILEFYHRQHHSSADTTLALTRERFWIRRGQVLANKVVSSCVTCRRVRKKPTQLEIGPLPNFRWQRYPVFSVVFMDLCGPFFCAADRRNTRGNPALSGQVWVLVIVCSVSHAVHIELLESYSTESLLSALDTFISFRGAPNKIIADQGSQLTAAGQVQSALQNHLSDKTEWNFVPSGAHQFVGMAEALVKAVKSCLEVLYIPKYTNLTKLQFSRVLYGIANLVNDRPLAVGRTRISKLDDMRLIRPNDLLLGRSTPDSLPPLNMEALENLSAKQRTYVELLKIRDACLNQFWVRFHSVVFKTILPRPKWIKSGRQFSVGDVVLVKDTNPIRGVWSWGQIDSILPSSDGLVREVIIRYKSGLESRGKKENLQGIRSKFVRKSVRDLALLLESDM